MAKSSAQPSHSLQVDVCPFLGRESEQQDGSPVPISGRDGAGELRPSPSFRCLALTEPARIDAGRQRRLCLSQRHTSCRRYGDAENDEIEAVLPSDTAVSSASLLPDEAEDEQDVRMRRIRRRYAASEDDPEGPRARVTVAGQPVDFSPRTAPEATEQGPSERTGDGPAAPVERREFRAATPSDADTSDEPPALANLGALWEEQTSVESSEELLDGSAPDDGESEPAEDAVNLFAGSTHDGGESEPIDHEAESSEPVASWNQAASPAAEGDAVWDSVREAESVADYDDDDESADTHSAALPQSDGARSQHDGDAADDGPSKTAVSAHVSGALGGLGAGDGGARRNRLMAVAGALLIVIGIATAVLAIVVGLDGAAETTVPVAAADAEPEPDGAAGAATSDGATSDGAAPIVVAPLAEDAAPPAAAAEEAAAEEAAAEETLPEETASSAEAPAAEASAPAGSVEPEAEAVPPEAEATAPTPDPTETAPVAPPGSGTSADPESESTPAPAVEEPAAEVPEEAPPVLPPSDALYGAVSAWPNTEPYTIAAGDTISSVAAQFNTHAYAIICLNQQLWSASQHFFTMIAGSSLIIPVDYVLPGDPAAQLAILQNGFVAGHCG